MFDMPLKFLQKCTKVLLPIRKKRVANILQVLHDLPLTLQSTLRIDYLAIYRFRNLKIPINFTRPIF